MNLSLSLVMLVLCLSTWEVKACSVLWAHPQSIYCRSDYVIEALVGEKRNVYLQDDGSFETAINFSYESDWRRFPTTQYSITIRKVFKGNVTKLESYLYTPPDGAQCGVYLRENASYLIMGYIRHSGLFVNLAGYTLDLTTLNDTEILHITDNAGKYFKQGCQDCYVNSCTWECPEQVPLINQCIWGNQDSLRNTRAIKLACVHTEEGICDWYNAMEPTMVPCDLDKDVSY